MIISINKQKGNLEINFRYGSHKHYGAQEGGVAHIDRTLWRPYNPPTVVCDPTTRLDVKALRKTAKGPGNVVLCDVSVPDLGPHDVLMKVYAAGVCGSDLLIQEDRHFYEAPVTLGHEFSGIVEKIGAEVTRVEPGDKIVADIECAAGRWLGVTVDGAFAPYMRMPEQVAYPVSNQVSLDHACLAEPIVATHHLIQERAQVHVGDDVVVVGPGPMGVMAVQYAKVCGARRVFLIGLRDDARRLEIGIQVGADDILYSDENPEQAVMDATQGKGAEFVLECSASEKGVAHAIGCVRKAYEGPGGKGVIVFISLWGRKLTLDLDQISLGQIDIRGSWSWNGTETWEHAVDLLNRGVFNLDPMITDHYRLEDWELAFANLRAKQDLKALIHPNGRGWAQ